MKTLLLRAAPLAALALAACNTQPTTVVAGDPADPTANQIAAAPPVKLPPALLASKSYRCKDNSIVYIDYFNDGLTANFKAKKTDVPVPLTAPAAGQAFTGGGYTLSGTPTAKSVDLTRPGKGEQNCTA